MHINETHFISAVSIAILFLISHFGQERGWYQRKGNWFSRIMHFFVGFFVAVFWSSFTRYFPLVVVLTFLVGVFWEIAEYFYGVYKLKKFGTRGYMIETKDTIEDLICDISGAYVAVLALSYII